MNIHDIAPLVVPVATAIAILIPVLSSFGSTKRRFDTIERTLQMLILHDEHLPDRERLNAGKRYLELGGNGATEIYYEELATKYRDRVEKKIKDDRS
jgi:hypothetical protein